MWSSKHDCKSIIDQAFRQVQYRKIVTKGNSKKHSRPWKSCFKVIFSPWNWYSHVFWCVEYERIAIRVANDNLKNYYMRSLPLINNLINLNNTQKRRFIVYQKWFKSVRFSGNTFLVRWIKTLFSVIVRNMNLC